MPHGPEHPEARGHYQAAPVPGPSGSRGSRGGKLTASLFEYLVMTGSFLLGDLGTEPLYGAFHRRMAALGFDEPVETVAIFEVLGFGVGSSIYLAYAAEKGDSGGGGARAARAGAGFTLAAVLAAALACHAAHVVAAWNILDPGAIAAALDPASPPPPPASPGDGLRADEARHVAVVGAATVLVEPAIHGLVFAGTFVRRVAARAGAAWALLFCPLVSPLGDALAIRGLAHLEAATRGLQPEPEYSGGLPQSGDAGAAAEEAWERAREEAAERAWEEATDPRRVALDVVEGLALASVYLATRRPLAPAAACVLVSLSLWLRRIDIQIGRARRPPHPDRDPPAP
eukprot:tig00000310_g23950.t1